MSWETEWDEPVQVRHPWRRFVVVVLITAAMLGGIVLPVVMLISGT